MMSVHDALEAWEAGTITSGHAMRLTGAADIMELHAFAHQSGVDIRIHLLPREKEQAASATAMIGMLLEEESREQRSHHGLSVK